MVVELPALQQIRTIAEISARREDRLGGQRQGGGKGEQQGEAVIGPSPIIALMTRAFLITQSICACRAPVLGSSSRRQAKTKFWAVTGLPSDQCAWRK